MLVAYLRHIGRRPPRPAERAQLGPMITRSDNGRADTVYRWVGDAALRALAARAGMRSFSVSGYWGYAQITAADQARFFLRIDRLVPPASRRYARRLLSSVVSWQRWGFSRAAHRAGFRIFFKGGWRGTRLGPPGARERPVRARVHALLHGRAHRRRSHPPVRHGHAAWGGAQDLPPRPRHASHGGRPAARAPPGGPRGREGTCAGDPRGPGLRRPAQPHRAPPARLLPPVGLPAAARGRRPRTRAAPPPPPWTGPPRAGCVPPGARPGGTRPVGPAIGPRRPGGALHRAPQPPQRRRRGGPHAGAALGRPPPRDGHGLRPSRSRRPHARGPGHGASQPADPEAGDGALRLQPRYWREWWHFEHRVQSERQLDLTLGCTRENPR